jgi:nucleotide-binding universal stress UspA family protein
MLLKRTARARSETACDSPLPESHVYQHILVPFDGSEASMCGLDEAIRLAKRTGAHLRLIHLVDDLQYIVGFVSYTAYANDVVPFLRRQGEQILVEGWSRAEKAGVTADTSLIEGAALRLADVVANEVRNWSADLVVIGTHGRRGVSRLMLGSDAEQILRNASVPVLLVRAPEDTTGALDTVATSDAVAT